MTRYRYVKIWPRRFGKVSARVSGLQESNVGAQDARVVPPAVLGRGPKTLDPWHFGDGGENELQERGMFMF